MKLIRLVSRRLSIFHCLGLSIGAAALIQVGGCALPEPGTFDPHAIQRPEKLAADEVIDRRPRRLPTTLESEFLAADPFSDAGRTGTAGAATTPAPTTGPALGVEPTLRMTLSELVQRAALTSHNVRVAAYAPAIDQTRVVEADARFDPVAFLNTQFERQDQSTAGTIIQDFTNPFGGVITVNDQRASIFSVEGGVRQTLDSGGQIQLSYRTQQTDQNPSQFRTDPFWLNEMTLQLTQPLLRDFGARVNRARVTIARNNQRISLLDFRQTLEETLTNVEKAYWQLVNAVLQVQIQEELLRRTYETAVILKKREGQDVTTVQIAQANASVESRRAILVRLKNNVRNLSDQLKRLVNDPQIPVAGDLLLLPATEPVLQPIKFDPGELIGSAMLHRLELGQQQLRINSAGVAVRVADSNRLPQLNLVGRIGFSGLESSFDEAVSRQMEFNHISYALGLQFEWPLGNREARAIWQRSLLQRQQAVAQYQSLVDQVALEVVQAHREVQTTWLEIVATRNARFAAAKALEAIEIREKNNEPLTPTFVQLKLDAQARVAETANAEASAIANYSIAISMLERAKGTLLRYNNIVMQEERDPFGPKSAFWDPATDRQAAPIDH